MQADARRRAILDILRKAQQPISATALAGRFSVSRQVIVGDVALLRTAGEAISATPRGYVMQQSPSGIIHQIACRHDTAGMEAELNAIVDHGCVVVDVVVEHPIYGQLTGALQMSSRYDVQQFIRRCQDSDARPLSDLTGGIHLHTIACPDEAAFDRVCQALAQLNILLESAEND